MKILALETSAKAVSAAVSENGRILASGYQDTGLTHSRTLMPIVEHILKNTDLKLSDMDAIAENIAPLVGDAEGIGIAVVNGSPHDSITPMPTRAVTTASSWAIAVWVPCVGCSAACATPCCTRPTCPCSIVK